MRQLDDMDDWPDIDEHLIPDNMSRYEKLAAIMLLPEAMRRARDLEHDFHNGREIFIAFEDPIEVRAAEIAREMAKAVVGVLESED